MVKIGSGPAKGIWGRVVKIGSGPVKGVWGQVVEIGSGANVAPSSPYCHPSTNSI